MSLFLVNGVQLNVPLAPETPFQDLLSYLKKSFAPENVLISSLKVNGAEITEPEEKALADIPFSQLKSIEVFTAHPREIADETLQGLLKFSDVLQKLCVRTGQNPSDPRFYNDFSKLLDGITTLTEGITCVKNIMKLEEGSVPALDALEDDLLAILKDLMKHQEQRKADQISVVLRERLSENLVNWKEVAIPALIRSRDC